MDTINLITTTLNSWSADVFDNVTDANALLFCFKRIGKLQNMNGNKNIGSVAIIPGGKKIEEDVVISETGNTGWVDYDEDLATDEKQVMASAEYDWKICYANAVAFEAQILANRGKYAKHNMVKTLIDNAESTLTNSIGKGLFNLTSANAKGPNGLPELITDDGTGTVGGLAASKYPLWKNKFVEVENDHTPDNLLAKMGELYRMCRHGIDIIVTGNTLYGEVENALTGKVMVQGFKGLEDAWFDFLRFHKAVVIMDENCPDNRMYFLNTRAIKMNFMKGAEITVGERQKQQGSMKHVWPVLAMMNWSVRSRRDLGVLVVKPAKEQGE